MCAYLSDEEFNRILDGIDKDVLNLSETTRVDPGKTATIAVWSPTSPGQVLVTAVFAEGSYGILQTGWGSRYKPTLVAIKSATPI